jgi:hypothetical protein
VTLLASSSGAVIDWYEAATGGKALLSGNNTYTTPSLTANKTYYAQARNSTTNCLSAARVAVTATINAAPGAPTMGGDGTQCGGTKSITATPGANGTGIRWTDNNSTASPRSVGTGTYYAVTTSAAGCESGTASVSVTINPIPGVPTMGGGGSQCGGTRSITATPGANGNGIRWTDNNSTTASRSVGTGTYYAVTTSAAGCESGAGGVSVEIMTGAGVGQAPNSCGCAAGSPDCDGMCRTSCAPVDPALGFSYFFSTANHSLSPPDVCAAVGMRLATCPELDAYCATTKYPDLCKVRVCRLSATSSNCRFIDARGSQMTDACSGPWLRNVACVK